MLTLPATVTIAEARDTLARLAQDATAEPGAELTLDASTLSRFDTSALAVLLEERHRLLPDLLQLVGRLQLLQLFLGRHIGRGF